MQGRTVIITGANSGIGKAAATALSTMGARVVITARTLERGEQARRDIVGESGNEAVEVAWGDFSRLSEVRALAEDLTARCPTIDVLVNNAGVILGEREVTEDGHEATFQINRLAPFLLTNLLRPHLEASRARIVNVSSTAHTFDGPLNFDDLQSERGYSSMKVYGRTKLMNILFTRELTRRFEGITANALHPGVVKTRFGGDGDMHPLFALGMKLGGAFMLSPKRGARTTIYLASSDDVKDTTGEYFAKCKKVRPAPFATDDSAATKLWNVSEVLVGLALQSARGAPPPT